MTENEEGAFSPGDETEVWYLVLQGNSVSQRFELGTILAHIPMTPDVDW